MLLDMAAAALGCRRVKVTDMWQMIDGKWVEMRGADIGKVIWVRRQNPGR